MKFKVDLKKLISLVLLPSVLLFFLSTTLNYHAHKLSTGGVYVHTHPFLNTSSGDSNKKPLQSSNKHTSENCISLKHLLSFNVAFLAHLIVFIALIYFCEKTIKYISCFKVSNVSLLLPSRAPPIL